MIKPAKIQVRFADFDMMGHINNAVYLSYFEQARLHYFEQLVGGDWDYKKEGMLLVKNEITYIKPIKLHEVPEISLHLIEMGNKSITLGYDVQVNGETRTTGSSKVVCFDFTTQKSVPVFPKMKFAFENLEQ